MTKALDDIHGPANVGQNFDPAAIPDRVFAHNRIPKRHPVPPERPRFCMTHFKPRFGGAFFCTEIESAAHLNQSPALRGSVRLRITHTN